MADIVKAAKKLGVDLTTVMTSTEIANLNKMSAKKATPIIEDAMKKAKKKADAATLTKLLADAGLA